MKKYFRITGMGCSNCVAAVEKAVKATEGVAGVNVSLIENNMSVLFNDSVVSEKEIAAAVIKAGYGCEVMDNPADSLDFVMKRSKASFGERFKKNAVLRQFIVSLVLLIPLLYLNIAGMLSLPVSGNINPYLQFILSTIILFINRQYFVRALNSIKNRVPGMDALIATGAGIAYLYSVYLLVRNIFKTKTLGFVSVLNMYNSSSIGNGKDNMYFFEAAGMIVTLITLGKMLEKSSKDKTLDTVKELMVLAPSTVHVLEEEEKEISLSELKEGDIVVIRSGGRIPADGEVVSGSGLLDTSALTGESTLVEIVPGMKLLAGSICPEGFFKMKVLKVGKDTTLSRIVESVLETGAKKAPIQRIADKISGKFVFIVWAVSLITLVIWLVLGYEASFAFRMMVSVIVISCPCALGLATPTAIMAGTANAAGHGILFRSPEVLENACDTDTVLLDKTGTVTRGELSVTEIAVCDGFDMDDCLFKAAVLETSSLHPYAKAIRTKALERFSAKEIMNYDTSDIKLAKNGVSGVVDKRKYYCGNREMMATAGIDISSYEGAVSELEESKKTVIFFADEEKLCCFFALTDAVRKGSIEAINEIKKQGMEVVLLTGDNQVTAERIGNELGIEHIIGGVLPDGKLNLVDKYQKEGRKVAMVGDGINDAPALTAANLGIAIGSGSDIALDSADIILMKNSINDVLYVLKLSKKTMRIIKQNLFWALIYNCIGIPIAAGVLYPSLGIALSPGISAACMSLSSLFVVFNALRLNGKNTI